MERKSLESIIIIIFIINFVYLISFSLIKEGANWKEIET